ncbi:MAG: hypothetical protein Q8R28_06925, partial [Dehalococcoidia bacterium]|nr:hypothetical protein [Dehalococcoidia bacterium]
MAKITPQAAHIALPRRQNLFSVSHLMILGGFFTLMAWSYVGTEFSMRGLLGGESAAQIWT